MTRRSRAVWLALGLLGTVVPGAGTTQVSPAPSRSLLLVEPFLEATPSEVGRTPGLAAADRVDLLADRHVYLADDLAGQFLAVFLGRVPAGGSPTSSLELELKDLNDGRVLEGKAVRPVQGPKLPVIVATIRLKPGRYELSATLRNATGAVEARASRAFERSARAEPRVAFPAGGIAIHVHSQLHLADGEWPITTGIPMPKGTLTSLDGLVLLENGTPVPAQFLARATWAPESSSPDEGTPLASSVKWVGVDFIARYDGGRPREYRLVHAPGIRVAARRPLVVHESPDGVRIDTGVVQFEIGRRPFAGIGNAWTDRNRDGVYAEEERLLQGGGGPFVVDDQGRRFDSAHGRDVQVVVEEVGPLQTTIAARGWYANASGETLCKFVIRFKAYAGQPFVSLSHRMIYTVPDRYVSRRLADVGFEIVPRTPALQWRFGADGRSHEGPPTPGSTFLHQDRADHFRLMAATEPLAAGRRAEGWMSVRTARGSITTFLRDTYQKFPKELELDFAPEPGRSKVVTHFWPRHGHRAFTEEEELARGEIYKVRYAHQGRLLDFRLPEAYHRRLLQLEKEESWAGADGQLAIVDKERGLTSLQVASGQGVALGNDLVVRFDDTPPTHDTLRRWAGLIQQSPHALADPRWNCGSGVFGPLAAPDPAKYGPAETLMEKAYAFYRRAIVEDGEEYGAWIYGGVHSNWNPEKHWPSLTRVWEQSHYQNVFQAWLLYFRSGRAEDGDWARIHSGQHLDVGVSNYLAYPEGTHPYARLGDIGGGITHCKGFLPWAGPQSAEGHWIDVASYFLRYYLTGDRRGLDLADAWMENHRKLASSNRRVVPASCAGFQDAATMARVREFLKAHEGLKKEAHPAWVRDEQAKPPPFNPREVLVPLGEMTQYYAATWDPQALIYLTDLAEHLNTPFECTTSPDLAAFGKHWQDWYYGLARDPRVVERIAQFLRSGAASENRYHYAGFAAFLFHITGDAAPLRSIVSKVYDETLVVYENKGERYDGFSLAQSNPAAMLLGRLPSFLHAVDKAGSRFERSDAVTALPSRGGRVDAADKGLIGPRGWSNTGVTVLAYTPKPTRLAISIDGPRSYGALRGLYQLFSGFPELASSPRPDTPNARRQPAPPIRFESANLLADPPEQRGYAVAAGGRPQAFPYVERAAHDPTGREYRLEHGGSPINLPVFLDADTGEPLTQAAVIGRTTFQNGRAQDAPASSKGVVDVFLRPLEDTGVVQLTFTSVHNRYWMPTKIRLTDAQGQLILDSSVFMAGERKELSVRLDPARHPLPWRLLTASWGDNQVHFTGVDELFFARRPEDLAQIVRRIRVRTD